MADTRDVVIESRFLGLDFRPVDLDLTHLDLNLIFKVFLHFSLMENPDSQSKFLIIYFESRL